MIDTNSSLPSVAELVSEMRSTGYYGRRKWISELEIGCGTALVCMIQLEATVCQLIPPWLDGGMDEDDLWAFYNSNFRQHLDAFCNILRDSVWSASLKIAELIKGVTEFLADLYELRLDSTLEYGSVAINALLVVMVSRQAMESDIRGNGLHSHVVWESNNVDGNFLSSASHRCENLVLEVGTHVSIESAINSVVEFIRKGSR